MDLPIDAKLLNNIDLSFYFVAPEYILTPPRCRLYRLDAPLGCGLVFSPGLSTTAFGSFEGCFGGNRSMSRCLFVKKHAIKQVILFVF